MLMRVISEGATAVHVAAYRGNLREVESLVKLNADVNIFARYMFFVFVRCFPVVANLKMMIHRRADVCPAGTPLDIAGENANDETAPPAIIAVLKAAGARCAIPVFPICKNLCRTLQVQS